MAPSVMAGLHGYSSSLDAGTAAPPCVQDQKAYKKYAFNRFSGWAPGCSHVNAGRHGNGKGGRRGKHGRGGRGINEVGDGLAAAAGGDGSSAKATEGSGAVRGCYWCGKEGHIRATCAEKLCSRGNERGHTADVCPTSEEEVMLAITGEVGA